jgi:hypothetical protein
MAFLVVVRRDEPSLFRYLQQHFQEPEVSVLMDRRYADRRQRHGAAHDERRQQDRRAVMPEDDPLWRYGFRVAIARS